jgi:hypothetical protein
VNPSSSGCWNEADAVDRVQDRHPGVAGTQEVRVQRVDLRTVADGAGGRHERLPCDLAPEDPLAVLVGTEPPEDVDLDGLDVEELDHLRQRGTAGGVVVLRCFLRH